MATTDNLLSIPQAAARMGIKPVTLRVYLARRQIGKVKIGRRVLLRESEVSDFIERSYLPPLPRHKAA